MACQEDKRKVIAELRSASNGVKAIIKATKYPKLTVYDIVKWLKGGKGIGHSPLQSSQGQEKDSQVCRWAEQVHQGQPILVHGGAGFQEVSQQEDGVQGHQRGPWAQVFCERKVTPA